MPTQRFNYDTVESKYGQKLTIQFSYDDAIVKALNRLSWPETHRIYNDPNDADAIVDYKCWSIDHTETALKAFEQELNTAVPNQYWPRGSPTDRSKVNLYIPEGKPEFRVETSSDRVPSLLDAQFSYPVEDAEYVDAYQNGEWDGREHIFDIHYQEAPIGLLDQTRQILEAEGFEVEVEWEARNHGRDINTSWLFDHELREYQHDTIEALLNNDGGIVALPTGTGKTVTGLQFIHTLDNRALILVHSRELLYQWAERIENTLGIEPGIIGDGKSSQGPVTVATLQTLMKQDGLNDGGILDTDYGIVIFDECHRTSAAEKMFEIATSIDAFHRVGLSATPWRRIENENLKIEAGIGSVAHQVSAESMIAQGYLANPTFDIIDPRAYGRPRQANQSEAYQQAKTRVIECDPTRLTAIADKAHELAQKGHQVLVNVSRKGHGRLIASALNSSITEDDIIAGIDNADRKQLLRECFRQLGLVAESDAAILSGSTPDKRREHLLESLENGNQQIVISTILKEGVDIPDLDAVVLAHGQKSSIEVIQTIGRALRPTGNREAMIVDIADRGRFFEEAYKERQQAVCDYYDLDQAPSVKSTPVKAVK